MIMQKINKVLKVANEARTIAKKAIIIADAAIEKPFNKKLARAARNVAIEAYEAAQAAEDAAMDIDPDEALENEKIWEVHCIGMRAADMAKQAADKAFHLQN